MSAIGNFLNSLITEINSISSIFDNFALLADAHVWVIRAIAVLTAVGGSYFFLTAFMPAVKFFHETKNTPGISKLMFTLHATVAFLFTLGGIILTALACTIGLGFSQGVPHLLLLGIVFICVNSCCWLGNSYIVKLKSENMKEASQMGMTEEEHYEKVVTPRLQSK